MLLCFVVVVVSKYIIIIIHYIYIN